MSARAIALIVLSAAAVTSAACRAGVPAPVPVDPGTACNSCRMALSDLRFASELLAPYEEPRFFDDLTCLARYLNDAGALRPGTAIYVADHRTKAWVLAGRAVYTQVPATSAPMGSRVLEHASTASRDADPEAAGGQSIDPLVVFGDARFLEGSR